MTAGMKTKAGAVALAAVLSVAGAGCLGGESGDHPEPVDAAAPTESSSERIATNADQAGNAVPVGATRVENGVPVGWVLDRAGAEAAANAYVRSTAVIARSGPLTRRDAVLTMATTSYGPTMVAAVNRELDGLTVGAENRSISPQELLWVEYPLAVTSTMAAPTSAQVRVWSILIVGIEGGSVARQVWRTSTITLTVEDGDWKIADWVDAEGPSPVALNDTDVASVADLHEVTSWTPVGSGS